MAGSTRRAGPTAGPRCDRGDGLLVYPDSFTSAFKRLARKAGMHPDTRLHDVRHAVATELGRQGVQPVIVSAVLGHASPPFTIAVYQHAWQEGPSEAAAALEASLGAFTRWQSVGKPGRPDPRRPDTRDEMPGQERWGGEDSNLRPADYESHVIRATPSIWCVPVLPSPT